MRQVTDSEEIIRFVLNRVSNSEVQSDMGTGILIAEYLVFQTTLFQIFNHFAKIVKNELEFLEID